MAVKALLNLLYDNVTQSPSEDKSSVQASMIANISKQYLMYHSEDLCEKSLQEMNTSVALLNLTTSMRKGSSES